MNDKLFITILKRYEADIEDDGHRCRGTKSAAYLQHRPGLLGCGGLLLLLPAVPAFTAAVVVDAVLAEGLVGARRVPACTLVVRAARCAATLRDLGEAAARSGRGRGGHTQVRGVYRVEGGKATNAALLEFQ